MKNVESLNHLSDIKTALSQHPFIFGIFKEIHPDAWRNPVLRKTFFI